MRCVRPAARNCSVSCLGHAAGVAEQEAGEQRALDRWQVRRSGQHQPAQSVGEPVERCTGDARRRRLGGVRPRPLRASTASGRRSRRARCNQPRSTTDSPADRIRRCAGDVAGRRSRAPGARRRRARRPRRHVPAPACRSAPASGSSTRVTTMCASACSATADASGDTSRPCRARCITAAPSNATANATSSGRAPPRRARTPRARARRRRPPAPRRPATVPRASPARIPPIERDQDDDRRDRQCRRRGHAASHGDERCELGEALVADAAHAAQVVDRREPAATLPLGDDRLGVGGPDARELLELGLASRC